MAEEPELRRATYIAKLLLVLHAVLRRALWTIMSDMSVQGH